MKKTNAIFGSVATASRIAGTLAVAGSLFANAAMADTSTTTTAKAAPKLLDKITASYWGQYSGPSLGSPSNLTTNGDNKGALDSDNYQNLDSTLTLGYKLTDNVTVAANYRFIMQTVSTADQKSAYYFNHDSWVSIKNSKLIHLGNFNMSVDLRGYVPILHSATLTTGFRSTQVSTFEVPKTRLSLGLYTFERANIVKSDASSYPNAQFDISPFASYQLTQTLSATFWSDVVQYDYFINKAFENRIVDASLGVNWDITQNFSVNPSFNFYPTDLQIDKTTLGLIVSAKFL